jgi:hypothetical protein
LLQCLDMRAKVKLAFVGGVETLKLELVEDTFHLLDENRNPGSIKNAYLRAFAAPGRGGFKALVRPAWKTLHPNTRGSYRASANLSEPGLGSSLFLSFSLLPLSISAPSLPVSCVSLSAIGQRVVTYLRRGSRRPRATSSWRGAAAWWRRWCAGGATCRTSAAG